MIDKKLGLPSEYFPKKLEIYKIPIFKPCQYVYMRQNDSSYIPVMIEQETFLSVWGDTAKVGLPEDWYLDPKLLTGETDAHFKQGAINPVPFPPIGGIVDNKVCMRDGLTRILWLLLHEVKILYFDCPQNCIKELRYLLSLTEQNNYNLHLQSIRKQIGSVIAILLGTRQK